MNTIGIDLGTTNSVACTIRHGQFEYLNFSGKDLLPSAILYSDGKTTVGGAAKRRAKINADHFISSAKTYMGMDKVWEIDNRVFTPTDVAGEVLKEIYKAAQKYFGDAEEIEAVITTPAQFSSTQNAETKKAGEKAGFIVKQILPEPTAAALAYAFEDEGEREKIYVVDLGGGTFDVALLEADGRGDYRMLMTGGDRRLGGDDFDQVIAELMMRELRKSIGVDLSTQEKSGLGEKEFAKAQQRLLVEAEKIKCALSQAESEAVDIVNLFPYQGGFYDLHMTITREEFLKEAAPLVRKVENVIRHSFDEIDADEDDVDRVILVGGSANMPFVRDCVKKVFDKEPYSNMDLSKLVAMGAAIRADSELGTGITLHNIVSHSMGVALVDDSLGKVLVQNEEYPCKHTETFYTVADYQEEVEVRVYEGEDIENVKNDRYLGGFTLDGIERALAGHPIEVTFSFDESCILTVIAEDQATGARQKKELDPTMEQQQPVANKKAMPYDIALLLDNSGSMYASLDTAKEACRRLVTDMIDVRVHRVAFITFESRVWLHCHLTHDREQLIQAIGSQGTGGSTNMDGALREAGEELEHHEATPLVIIVTDGEPDSKDYTTIRANQLKERGIRIVAIGAGNVDHDYLASLASSHQDYYPLKDMSGLANAFQSITNGLKLH